MELRCLRYFVAVAQEQSFSRAAKLLHISQPPLSRRIRAIEEELGVALFERNTRNVRLTAAGAAFYEQTRRTLEQVEKSVRAAQKTTKGEMGTIRFGYLPNDAMNILTKLPPQQT